MTRKIQQLSVTEFVAMVAGPYDALNAGLRQGVTGRRDDRYFEKEDEMLPANITIGDKYRPAMEMTDQAEADAYFELCVKHTIWHLLNEGKARDEVVRAEAERIERMNLGYFAGYYDSETRERVERLFHCAHPIFGAIAERGAPSIDSALMTGVRAGMDSKAKQ